MSFWARRLNAEGKKLRIPETFLAKWPNVLAALSLLILGCLLWLDIFPEAFQDNPLLLWLALFLALATVFSIRSWIKVFSAAWIVESILYRISIYKFKSLNFPLTFLDLQMFFSYPFEILNSVGLYQLGPFNAENLVLLIALCFLVLAIQKKWQRILQIVVFPFLKFLVSMAVFSPFFHSYGESLQQRIQSQAETAEDGLELWNESGLNEIAQQKGALAFFAYSNAAFASASALLKIAPENFENRRPSSLPNFAEEYLESRVRRPENPNIVFILTESTFDPNRVFRLNKRFESPLFSSGGQRSSGSLIVSTVGGGTWISEFEVLNGIESRPFGILGNYPHSGLSPFAKNSFAHFLKLNGYQNRAFYPTTPEFQSARFGFMNYGFERFLDSKALGLPGHWSSFSDEAMVIKVLQSLPGTLNQPSFSFITLLENHSPHPCQNFTREKNLEYKFEGESDFNKNCPLNEYLRRIQSSERAIARVIDRMKLIEKNTGRPYIVLSFGDHQPLTFTGPEFAKHRLSRSDHLTFYSITHSPNLSFLKIDTELHISMMPTFVSLMFAQNLEDVYLPQNLWVYEKCRADLFDSECPEKMNLKSQYLNLMKFPQTER